MSSYFAAPSGNRGQWTTGGGAYVVLSGGGAPGILFGDEIGHPDVDLLVALPGSASSRT